MPDKKRTHLTLDEIQLLTGHDTTDGVRMALKRAGIKADGLVIGTGNWPPKKLYPASLVWDAFGRRMLDHAAENPKAKELCWTVYGPLIMTAIHGEEAATVFADKLDQRGW